MKSTASLKHPKAVIDIWQQTNSSDLLLLFFVCYSVCLFCFGHLFPQCFKFAVIVKHSKKIFDLSL